jgi:adenylosuccinate synthase
VVLREELALLPAAVKDNLVVDGRCSLVSPSDKELDAKLEEMRGASAIGTTKRGIGPSYATRALRLSPRVSDLLRGFDFGPLSLFYQKFAVNLEGLSQWAEDSKSLLRNLVGNASNQIAETSARGGSVLFEGSQGSLLDLLHGSYPFVTATHTLASYVPAAMGIPPSMAGKPLGVTKCYATRVGSGPFPTEIKGAMADTLRTLGNEYGATTGRPRRVGWLDLVALRYTVRLNEVKNVAVSKLDVLSQVKDFKVCIAYRYQGRETSDFQSSLGQLEEVEPIYESPFSLQGSVFDGGLPQEGQKFVNYLEKQLDVNVSLVSHGEERSKTIEL